MIEEQYVSFETAKLLKEKGFDEYCPTWYDIEAQDGPRFYKTIGWHGHNSYDYQKNIISMPTQQMACRWLREVHKLACNIDCMMPVSPTYKYYIYHLDSENKHTDFKHYDTYEECAENAIKHCLEHLIK